jgi:hypothetical protein
MSDEDSQIQIPPSFIAIYVPAGRIRPTATRERIAQRHELCEDLAQMLIETAQNQLWQTGITEADVLERVHRGLQGGVAGLDPAEADWVVHRLAEVLGWADPVLGGAAPEA